MATLEQAPSKTKDEIIREAKRIEESLLHSSKGHFAASLFWGKFHLWIGIPVVIMSTLAGASFLSKFEWGAIIAGALSMLVAVLSAIMTFLNPNEKVSAHLDAGNAYDALMNQVRIFYSIDCWGSDDEASLTEKIKYFSQQKTDLNMKCPQIPKFAYRVAKQGIDAGEATYQVDEVLRQAPAAIGKPDTLAIPK